MHSAFIPTKNDVIVIGGGAAGLMAAYFAAANGAKTLLIEKNEKLGKKIYITGKGRCNVTNDTLDNEEFLRHVMRNPRFLYGALKHFSPQDMQALLEQLGCPVKVERGRRVFPVSDKASDVTRALESGVRSMGGSIRLSTEVKELLCEGDAIRGVLLKDGTRLEAAAVIVCTGGLSYPSTGSTGDGYRFAKETGHQLMPTSPSLTGLNTAENWPSALEGLSLKNIGLTCTRGQKVLYKEQGEMLFTHYGISGPLVLQLSSMLAGEDLKDVRILLDLKSALTNEQLDERLQREIRENGARQFDNMLKNLLPQRMAELFPKLCGIDGTEKCGQISLEKRRTLLTMLKALPLTPASLRGYNEAVVTRGGVSVKDVSPRDCQSKLIRGLYFAGEVLDLDAHTGGYNLQIAFSTAALAGENAALQALTAQEA